MININKILCPVDFSRPSTQALRYATFLASILGSKLYLLHVVEHLQGFDRYLILFLTPAEIEARLRREAKKHLDALADEIQEQIEIFTMVREGRATDEIVKLASKEQADLIVLGSHGSSGLKHLILGSVARKVASQAPCPVSIVRFSESEVDNDGKDWSRDFSVSSFN